MLGLKLNHVSKSGPRLISVFPHFHSYCNSDLPVTQWSCLSTLYFRMPPCFENSHLRLLFPWIVILSFFNRVRWLMSWWASFGFRTPVSLFIALISALYSPANKHVVISSLSTFINFMREAFIAECWSMFYYSLCGYCQINVKRPMGHAHSP